MFQNMWDDWGIQEVRQNLLVRDGAANMSLGGDLADINSIHCTVHRLQLVIQDAILSQRSIINLLAKCRQLATHFNHSALACTELKSLQEVQEQGKTPLLLVQDVPTRWNSSYLMVERVVKLKRPIQLYLSDHDNLPTITANEWQISERLLHILKPFFDLTKEMSGEYSILSDVIPNIATLELFLSMIGQGDQGVQSTREELLRALWKRFLSPEAEVLNVMNENAYVTATCIDPRYKDHFYPSTDDKQQAKAWLVEELFLVHQKLHGEEDNNNQESQLPPHSPQRKRTKEDDLFRSWKYLLSEQTLHQLLRPGNKVVGPVKRSRTLHKRLTHFCHCHSSTENVIHSNGGRMQFNSHLCRSLHGSYFVHLHLPCSLSGCTQNMGTYL